MHAAFGQRYALYGKQLGVNAREQIKILVDGGCEGINLIRAGPFDLYRRLRRQTHRLFFHPRRSPGDLYGLGPGLIHGFTAEIVRGSKAPRIIHQHADADAQGLSASSVADFAIFGGQRALAVIDNANVGVTSAALRDGVQGPVSNLFHAHSKFPTSLILMISSAASSVGFKAFGFGLSAFGLGGLGLIHVGPRKIRGRVASLFVSS